MSTLELSADGLEMPGGINSGLPIARLLMVVSSLAPLFLLWAIRGAPPISDCYWVTGCLALAVVPNLALLWRWRVARRSNDHRVIVVASARDQSDHLLVYLFAMLLPLYSVKVTFIECTGLADYVAKHRRAARLVAALHSRTDLHTIKRNLFVKAAKDTGITLIENGRKLTPAKGSELGVLEMLDDRRYTTALKAGQKPAFVASSRRRL